jgi:hypothetical protein
LFWAAIPRLLRAQASQRLGIPVFSPAATGAAQQGILTAANFEKLIGTSFHAFLDNDVVVEIVLRKVKVPTFKSAGSTSTPTGAPGKPTVIAARRGPITTTCFMLTFATGSTLIPQDSYVLDNGTLGSFAAFLVPGQSVPGSQTAIATFNFL